VITNPTLKTLTQAPRQTNLYEAGAVRFITFWVIYAIAGIGSWFGQGNYIAMSGPELKKATHFYSFLLIFIQSYSLLLILRPGNFGCNWDHFSYNGAGGPVKTRMLLCTFVVFCYALYALVTQRGGLASAPHFNHKKSYLLEGREGKKQLPNMPILEMGAVKTPSLLFPFVPFYSLFDLAESRWERKKTLKRIGFYGLWN